MIHGLHERDRDITTFTDAADHLRRWLCFCGVSWTEPDGKYSPVSVAWQEILAGNPAAPQPQGLMCGVCGEQAKDHQAGFPCPQPADEPKVRFREFL